MLGLGVVGSGVASVLLSKTESLGDRAGCPLELLGILVRDKVKKRSVEIPPGLLTTNPSDILHNPAVDIVVELMGGEQPALEYIELALDQGKSVVTANKEVIAKFGPRLFALAQQRGANLLFEASAGGGIPIVASLQEDFQANQVTGVEAIINGTTNYMLTQMAHQGIDFQVALEEAQKLGYAEPDPTNDIEGIDAAYKLAILATLAFQVWIRPQDVYHEGISQLAGRDFRYARELGYVIKLLAIAKEENEAVQARVHPVFLHQEELLAKVDGVFNAIQIEGDLMGKVLLYGQGAGPRATASAILADVLDITGCLSTSRTGRPLPRLDSSKRMKPITELETRYYIRMNVTDRPGVLAQITKILGDWEISIASVIQKEAYIESQSAEIVIMTQKAREAATQEALRELRRLEVVNDIGTVVRVED